ncbi:hypothetical protein JTE90_008847 [Oedothorax gibbosus]|uniref:protein-tyrosine-phosphatase n=1 Tax=Oedothorax gibbosus TaxID=931172 RepID=A0AAV6U2D2_9ARAC|nr:hypothetical protein JTE90_008847 [Oedothorax gibbosus]
MKPPLRTVLKNFLNHFENYEARRKSNDDQYEYEFQQLKNLTDTLREDPEYPCSIATKDVNRPKNRYKDIVPYDKSRVILPKCEGIPGSDYINASYVKGASGALAYIAAQGPLPNTVIDFWRMVWICDVQVVVMACNEKEAGKGKCECYWPQKGEVMNYGNIAVELISTSQVCPDFLIRTLLVKCGTQMRDVYQFHYTTWPDHGVPETVQPILELVRLMRDCQATEIMPILVHCSAGCGRTGTICAVDYVWACLRQGKLSEDFSLFEIAMELRRQRIAMIQTKEQYILAHRAVATLFEQQLSVIDCHIYVNVDEDGEPLMWKELTKKNVTNSKLRTSLSKETSPQKAILNNNKEERRISLDDSINKPTEIKPPIRISPQGDSEPGPQIKSSTEDKKQSFKTSVSGSLVSKSSDSSYSRNSILSQQSNDDSIPFIDDDEVCVRPNCGRAYLNMPSADSIIIHFDPFVDKVAEDSSPDADECLQEFKAKDIKEDLKEEDRANANAYSTLPSSSNKKKDYPINNRESYPPSNLGLSRFHNDSVSDIANSSADSIKGSSKKTSKVVRRPSIAKLKALFEKSGVSFKSSSEGGKRSLFRNNSHSVSRAGSAPPSLNMDKTTVDRESILSLVTRKFRSSSVHNEREISPECKHRRSTSDSFKEGFATLSRTVSFNLNKTFRGYSPSKAKPAKANVSETGRVSFVEDKSEEAVKSKGPEVQPKGKSMWYDKSSLPRPVTVAKPIEKYTMKDDAPKSPIDYYSDNSASSPGINKPPKLLPFFGTLNKTNGKDATAMWYSHTEEPNMQIETPTAKSSLETDPKPTYKRNNSKVLPFINSIAPWKKATTKSPISSPDSPKSITAFNQFPIPPAGGSKFYTAFEDSNKKPIISKLQDKAEETPVCPIPEEIIPLSIVTTDDSVTANDKVTTEVSNSSLPLVSESISFTKPLDKPEVSLSKENLSLNPRKDVPPAIPKKIGKHKQVELKQAPPKELEITLETSIPLSNEDNATPKEKSLLAPNVKEKLESVPSSPKDLYINVNIKAKKNIEQIENTIRNNPRGAIIDLTSRESYCMEDELDNALKQLSEPANDCQITANKGSSKFPGYEVIWPETSYPNGNYKLTPGIQHCKTGLCYSPPLRRSINANIGLVKCRSCSNINCLEQNENKSLDVSKEPSSIPSKQHFTDAVVELNTLLDKLTTRTLTDETEFDKIGKTLDRNLTPQNITSNKCESSKLKLAAKDNTETHSVTLLSKPNNLDGSPPKEEEIIFHFPPPPLIPPPADDLVSETFNIVRKNGSLLVSETSKTKDSSTDTSILNIQSPEESNDASNNPVPQPTPRKSKQALGLRRSASYTNVFPQKGDPGYENVFLEKYHTLNRLQIDPNISEQENKSLNNSNKEAAASYVNINPLTINSKSDKTTSSKQTTGSSLNNNFPPRTFVVDEGADNKNSTYGKLIHIPNTRLHISEENRTNHPDQIRKRPTPSTKSEKAPMPPDSKDIKSDIAKKFSSRKSEKAPLPPPLLQKSASAINAAKNRPNYVNFPLRTHKEEAKVLPAVHENITNNLMSSSAIGIGIRTQVETKNSHSPSRGQGLAHSQSDASVFKSLKDRKSQSLGRGMTGLDPKQLVLHKGLQKSKESTPVSSSDSSDSSYERIYFEKTKEQSERQCSVKEQIKALNSIKSFKKDMPVAPPRAKRRNTTEVNYAKVKNKEATPFLATSSSVQDQQKNSERKLHIHESPPALPVKTKDAFEIPDTNQRTAAWVQQSGFSSRR